MLSTKILLKLGITWSACMRNTYGIHVYAAVELLMLILCLELIVMEHLQVLFLNNDAIKNEPVLWSVKLINIYVTSTSIFLTVINANNSIGSFTVLIVSRWSAMSRHKQLRPHSVKWTYSSDTSGIQTYKY